MTDISISSRLRYRVDQPTAFAFAIVAARTPFQVVTAEQISIDTKDQWNLVPYGEGSHQLLRCAVQAGEFEVAYSATVAVNGHGARPHELDEVPFEELPAEVLPYLNPSRYCESDKLGNFAWRHFSRESRGYARVQAVSDWVTENLVYAPGSTNVSSSTTDVLLNLAGVCRDFAHVAISLCRALGIPARYVSGYGVGVEPQDFHGFFEAYIGTDWYLFDPTGMSVPSTLVRIGYGRDAADAAFATLVGQATLIEKIIEVSADGSTPPQALATSTA